MKGKKKNLKKSIVAWICVMTMLVGCLSGVGIAPIESKAAETGYTEYTFSDFGINDQQVTNSSPEWGTGLASWDKVAINGKVSMPGTGGEDHYIRFGSWTGFEIRSAGGSIILTGGGGGFGATVENSDGNTNGWVYIATDGGVGDGTSSLREVPIRITMEHVGENLKVSVTVDGGYNTGWITFKNQSNDNFKMLVYSKNDKTIGLSSESLKTDKDSYISGIDSVKVTAVSTGTDWIGVFKKDVVDYTQANAEEYYNVADYNGISYEISGLAEGDYQVCLMTSQNRVLLSKTIAVNPYPYTNYTFRDFGLDDQQVSGKDVMVSTGLTSWENVVIKGKVTFPGVDADDHYIRFGGWSGLSLRAYSQGIILTEGSSATGGVVDNSNHDGNGWLYIGAGEDISNKEINLCITFEHVNTTQLKMTATVNETYSGYITVANQSIGNFDILVHAAEGRTIGIASTQKTVSAKAVTSNIETEPYLVTGNCTVTKNGTEVSVDSSNPVLKEAGDYIVKSNTNGIISERNVGLYVLGDVDLNSSTIEEPVETGYTEYTFSDFGINDQQVTNSSPEWGTGLASWDKVAINGKVSMPGTDGEDHYIRFGSWNGFEIRSAGGSIILTAGGGGFGATVENSDGNTNGWVYIATDGGVGDGTSSLREVPIRITMEHVGENLKVSVTVDGGYNTGWITFKNQSNDNFKMLVYSKNDKTIGLSSVAAGISTGGADITSSDVQVLSDFLNEKLTLSAAQKKAADLNNDGNVNNTDLKLLQDIVNGTQTREAVLDKYYPAAVRYEYLESDGSAVMPIVGYESPSADSSSQEYYNDIEASGINILMSYPCDYFDARLSEEKKMELAQNAGLGYLVKDSNLNYMTLNSEDSTIVDSVTTANESTMAKKIGNYSYFDSYLGNFIADEPTLVREDGKYITPTSTNNVRYFGNYETITKQLNSYANTMGYVNLPAGVWFKGTEYGGIWYNLTEENIAWYEQVVKEITEKGNAKVLSFDRYLGGTGETAASCPRYFLNLDIIRAQAQTSDIPFWAYVPVGEWKDGDSTSSNSKEDMYWSVNTSLAFGAKGIQYFTLVEPKGYASDGLTMGLYANDNTKNEEWYNSVARTNKLIAAVDDVLMKSENKGIIATGGNAQKNAASVEYAKGTSSITTQTREIQASATYRNADNTPNYAAIKSDDNVSRVESITTTNATAGAFAGVFDYQGKVALYVVNNDTANAQDITVQFAEVNGLAGSNYRVIGFDASGDIEDITTYGIKCTRNVGAGEAFLLIIDEEELATTSQYFEDITSYRSGDAYTAPELDGYVFAGWFNSKEEAEKDYAYDTTQSATVSDEEVAGALDSYKEYTFSDFGLEDQEVTSGSALSTKTPEGMTSLDKVAISGKVSMLRDDKRDNHYIYLTFKNADGNAVQLRMWSTSSAIWMQYEGGGIGYGGETGGNHGENLTDNGWIFVAAGEELTNEYTPIRMTFEHIADTSVNGKTANFKMTLTVNDNTATTGTLYFCAQPNSVSMTVYEGLGQTLGIASERPVQPAYAKFVDESVLSLKVQLDNTTTATSESAKLRLLTTTNSLVYQNIGFKLQTEANPTGAERTSTQVYRKIKATNSGLSYTYDPNVFSEKSQYFATVTLAVSNANNRLEESFTITPFWTTYDGTKVYGTPRTVTIQQGLDARSGK